MLEPGQDRSQRVRHQTVPESPAYRNTDPTLSYNPWLPPPSTPSNHMLLELDAAYWQQNSMLPSGIDHAHYNPLEYQAWCWNILAMPEGTTSSMADGLKLEPTFKIEALVKVEPQPETTTSPAFIDVTKTIYATVKQEGLLDKMKLSKNHQMYVKAIVDAYKNRQDVIEGSFERLYQREVKIYTKTLSGSFKASASPDLVRTAMNRIRCNSTKHVRATLRYMVKASAELFPETTQEAAQLFNDLHTCSRVEHFSDIFHSKVKDAFLGFFRMFVDPGHLFVSMIRRMNYPPAVSILMLEVIPVLRRMANQPTISFSSWMLEKWNVVGDYSEPIQRLQEGKASFQEVHSWVDKEYMRCKSKFKKTVCSAANNVTHFLCQLTQRVLGEIHQHLRSDVNQATDDLEEVLLEEISQLRLKPNEQTLFQVAQHPFIREQVNSRLLPSNRLLIMVLETKTNALMIKNLVNRYPSYVGLFTS